MQLLNTFFDCCYFRHLLAHTQTDELANILDFYFGFTMNVRRMTRQSSVTCKKREC